MNRPIPRLVDDPETRATPLAALLREGAAHDPPEGAHGAVWAALEAKLAGPPSGQGSGGTPSSGVRSVGGPASAASAPSRGALSLAGSVLGGAAVAVVGLFLGEAFSPEPHSEPRLAPKPIATSVASPVVASSSVPPPPAAPPAASSSAPSVVAPAIVPDSPSSKASPIATTSPVVEPAANPLLSASAPPPEPPAAPESVSAAERASAPAPTPEERASHLREESRLVAEARKLLRIGEVAAAQLLLKRAAERFPDGALAQEREALAIEALLKRGRRDEARARAADFVRKFPSSPHAQSLAPLEQ